MKKTILLVLFLPFLLAAGPSRATKAEDARKRIEQLEESLAILRQELAAVQEEVALLHQVIRISPLGVQIRSDHGLQIQALGSLDLKGKVIRLNGGDRPVATVGSKISAPPLAGSGTIIEGSPTVLVK